MTDALLITFLASLGLDWPGLPGNARLAEILVIPVIAAALLRRVPMRLRVLDIAVLSYLAASAVATVASANRAASGVELARHVYLVVIYVTVARLVASGATPAARMGLALMGIGLAVPSMAVAIVTVLYPVTLPAAGEVMTLPYVGDVLRLRGFTYSPTMFASVLTMALPFALANAMQAQDLRATNTWTISTIVMLMAVMFSFSHVWAGTALAITIMLWPKLADRRVLRLATVAAVIALSVVFNATLIASVRAVSTTGSAIEDQNIYPYAVDAGHYRIGAYTVDYAVMSYFRIKELALEAFAAHPIAGVGLDQFHSVTRAAYGAGRLPHGYREIDPHSSLLGRLAETGIVGGVTLVVLWVVVLQTGVRRVAQGGREADVARAAVAGIAGLLLAGVNVDIMNFRFLWAAFAVVRGLTEGDA